MNFSGGYYDIEDILAGEERIKCTFLTDAADCAFLDPSCLQDDLKSGTKVELPLWLAETLVNRGDVNMEIPVYLSTRFRRMIQAGPASVNLREFSVYFFEVAKHILPLVNEQEAKEIVEILRLAFGGERYRNILNNSMNSQDEDTTEFTRKLTESEKLLFDAGMLDSTDFIRWKGRKNDLIEASKLVERCAKKRRMKP
jgi:GINS complex subunit 3